LEETLRSAGYETQSVQSGTRTLEVLSSKLVSAVFLDLLMPAMDGLEVIRHVRQDPRFERAADLCYDRKDSYGGWICSSRSRNPGTLPQKRVVAGAADQRGGTSDSSPVVEDLLVGI
jgi:CheY-like chemotaxis protein